MKRVTLVLLALSAAAIPATADATPLPGPNGPLIITSARGLTNDTSAIFTMTSDSDSSPTKETTQDTLHHRHATWSPDRTKIAYARAIPANYVTGPWQIYVQDLKANTAPVQLTTGHDERPSWSPDGTRIAYQSLIGGQWTVQTKPANGNTASPATPIATTLGTDVAGVHSRNVRPNWSADSQFLYYAKVVTGDLDIYRSSAAGGDLSGSPVVATDAVDEFQPSPSGDGTKLCYTRDNAGDKDVYTATIAGGSQFNHTNDAGTQEYECAWSPDVTRVAYVRGAFGAGEIQSVLTNGTGLDNISDVGALFDGNPEWAPNPRPTCNDTSKQIAVNGFATVPLACFDEPDPPSYFDNGVQTVDIQTPPTHGILGQVIDDESVIYTPNVNFNGTDSFTFKGDDGNSDSNTAKATITVGTTGGGGGSDTTKPTATLSGSTKQNLAKQKAVVVTVQPNEAAALSATGSVNVPGASKSFKLGKASGNAGANAKVKLRLKISSKAVKAIRKAVKKGKRVKATVSITAKDAAGNSASFKRTVRAKAK